MSLFSRRKQRTKTRWHVYHIACIYIYYIYIFTYIRYQIYHIFRPCSDLTYTYSSSECDKLIASAGYPPPLLLE